MYDYMLLEMAEAISQKCNIRVDDVKSALAAYWQDKVAHVWQADDMLEAACQAGNPITRMAAAELLKDLFDLHDSSRGITWASLEEALGEYRLGFSSLLLEQYGAVHGVFTVWREHDAIAQQFGLFPKKTDGNFPDALDFARSLAQAHPHQIIFLGCESSLGKDISPWLIIRQEDNQAITITESEELNHVPMD